MISEGTVACKLKYFKYKARRRRLYIVFENSFSIKDVYLQIPNQMMNLIYRSQEVFAIMSNATFHAIPKPFVYAKNDASYYVVA